MASEKTSLLNDVGANKDDLERVHTAHYATNYITPGGPASGGAFVTPKDEYNRVYISMAILGLGFLTPWQSMLSVTPYFINKYGADSVPMFTSAYMIANLFGLGFVTAYGDKISFTKRIVPGFLLFLTVLALLLFLPKLWMAVVAIVFFGFADSIVQGSVFALAGVFHPRFVGSLMTGIGTAGIIISAVLIVILVLLGPEEVTNHFELSTHIFFALSGVLMIACIVMFLFIVQRSPVTKHYLAKSSKERTQYVTGSSVVVPEASKWRVLRKIWLYAFVEFFTFFVTLAIFPNVLVPIQSQNAALNEKGKSSVKFIVILIAIFNVFDFVGRSICSSKSLVFLTRRTLPWACVLRVLFVPFFIACVVKNADGVPYVHSDLAVYIVLALFALSNGYVSTVGMMLGSSDEQLHVSELETAGAWLVFLMTFGLSFGVVLGTILNIFWLSKI